MSVFQLITLNIFVFFYTITEISLEAVIRFKLAHPN